MSKSMTARERIIATINGEQLKGRVPHFELAFYPTMETFGRIHPAHRNYYQWDQMREKERQLHREDIVNLQIAIAEKYEHSAIFLQPNPSTTEELMRIVDIAREKTGDRYFLMFHGDATYAIPNGDSMLSFSYRLFDEPKKIKAEAETKVNMALARGEQLANHGGLDGFALCDDYCLNTGPFISPSQFSEFIAPYLDKLISGYRDMGFYCIKHTDGDIMPIVDQLVQCAPHALHSIDPQGGVDIAEIKRLYGKKLCLIGNVNCSLMDTGTDEEIIESARYALKHGMPYGRYIFSTSNCIYTGMPLSSYELILDIWRKEGNYK